MKSKYSMMVLTFLIGIIVGGLIIWLTLCCCCKKNYEAMNECCQHPNFISNSDTINVLTANRYFRNYYKSPIRVDSLKGFTITMAQYDAMNFILKNETKNSVHGFRFYLGNKKEGAEPIIIVVGTGSPDKTHPIVVTPGPGSGPCPYVCDNGSPITK